MQESSVAHVIADLGVRYRLCVCPCKANCAAAWVVDRAWDPPAGGCGRGPCPGTEVPWFGTCRKPFAWWASDDTDSLSPVNTRGRVQLFCT